MVLKKLLVHHFYTYRASQFSFALVFKSSLRSCSTTGHQIHYRLEVLNANRRLGTLFQPIVKSLQKSGSVDEQIDQSKGFNERQNQNNYEELKIEISLSSWRKNSPKSVKQATHRLKQIVHFWILCLEFLG